MKLMYTREEGGVSIVVPIDKNKVEQILGPLTDEEYRQHVVQQSIPQNIEYREISDEDLPLSREWRNAWCDVTDMSKIDIDCTKAKEIALSKIRQKREELFKPLDQQFMLALENGSDLTEIKAKKQALRDLTNPVKAIDTTNKFNDETILNLLSEHVNGK